jgi:hypothetical protein
MTTLFMAMIALAALLPWCSKGLNPSPRGPRLDRRTRRISVHSASGSMVLHTTRGLLVFGKKEERVQ